MPLRCRADASEMRLAAWGSRSEVRIAGQQFRPLVGHRMRNTHARWLCHALARISARALLKDVYRT